MFADLGYQSRFRNFAFEVFGGLGIQTGRDNRYNATNCTICKVGSTVNALNWDWLALRFGIRVGYLL